MKGDDPGKADSLCRQTEKKGLLREGGAYRVLQGGEADEAQEELSARGHGHGGVHTTQDFYGMCEIRSQALKCLSCNDEVRNVMFIYDHGCCWSAVHGLFQRILDASLCQPLGDAAPERALFSWSHKQAQKETDKL